MVLGTFDPYNVTFIMFSVLLRTDPGGPDVGTGGAEFNGGTVFGSFGALSTDALLLSFAFDAVPFGS